MDVDIIFELIKELSVSKENLLESAILDRLDLIENKDNLSAVLASINRYNSKELCTLIKRINKTILEEQSKIDRIFYKEPK